MVSRIVLAWLLATVGLAGGLPGGAAGQGRPARHPRGRARGPDPLREPDAHRVLRPRPARGVAALEPFRRAIIDDDRRFAAHVALYPYCSDWSTAAHVTGAPLLFLLGGRDDYTPPEAGRGYAEWFKTAGAETTVVTYASAYHDFDAERPPRYERALVTGRGCDMAVDLDHFTVARRGTGEDITASAGQYGRNCLSRGATIGGDTEARRRAPEDVAAFPRRVLGPETH